VAEGGSTRSADPLVKSGPERTWTERVYKDAAELVGIRPSTVKRHLADLRARSGLTTEQLSYAGRASGRLVVPSLEPN
jgi:hypothetical protein